MTNIWKYIQYLSLDVVAGAVISAVFVGKVFGAVLTRPILFGLGIAIWLIYTADHLMDARNIKGNATNSRHAYHQRNFKWLALAGMILFAIGVWNIFYLPIETVKIGGGLIVLVGLYFLLIQLSKGRMTRYKELSAAMVYGFGIFAGPVSLVGEMDWMMGYLFIQFFLMALLNLLIFPLYEIESDNADQMKSLVLQIGQKKVHVLLRIIFSLSLVMFIVGIMELTPLISNDNWIRGQWIICAMLLVLYGLMIRPKLFEQHNLYRVFGDGIFFLPALILI